MVVRGKRMEMTRILLVDDQERIRQGLRMRLALEEDLQVIGEARSGDEAIRLAQALQPDVVVLDVEIPGGDGIAVARQLAQMAPCCPAVILSLHEDRETRRRAAAAGVVGFVVKGHAPEELLAVLRAVGSSASPQSLRQKSEAHPSNGCTPNPSEE